jgi:hypothetical protein
VVAGAMIGLGLAATLVVRTSQAMFTGTTTGAEDRRATGGAAIGNDDGATAAFDSSTDTLTGGQILIRRISVAYDGSTTALNFLLAVGHQWHVQAVPGRPDHRSPGRSQGPVPHRRPLALRRRRLRPDGRTSVPRRRPDPVPLPGR